MKKVIIVIIIALVGGFVCLQAQEKIDVQLTNQPITQLFEVIESRSNQKIFCDPDEMSTITVSISCSQCLPIDVLKKALEGYPFTIIENNQDIFIIKDETSISQSIINNNGQDTTRVSRDSVRTHIYMTPDEEAKKEQASNEYKLYEVGRPQSVKPAMANLTGYIISAKTKEPIPGVVVYIVGTNYVTTSDEYGYYSLQVPTGQHELNLSGSGQQSSTRRILIHSDGQLDIQSFEKIYELKGITIQADAVNHIKQMNMGVERLMMKEIKNIPTAMGEADIMRVIIMLPGVKSTGELASGMSIRGGATDQNLILFNGGTIYNPTHIFGILSSFNPDLIKDAELYKSSIPAKYGGRISSVLEINSRDGDKSEYHGALNLGVLSSRAYIEGPLVKNKSSFIFGGRLTYSDWILSQLPKKSGYQDGRAGFYDINLGLNHTFNDRNTLYFSGYYSKDRFRFQQNELYKYRNANASLKWRHVFSPKLTGAFSAGYDHYDYDIENTEYAESSYRMKFNINQGYFRSDFTWFLNNDHTINLGLNSVYYNLEPGEYSPQGSQSLVLPDVIETEKALESALYIGDQWTITPQFAIDLGIRYSIFNVLGTRSYNIYDPEVLPSLETISEVKNDQSGIIKTYHGPEFRFSARYAFNPDLSVKAGFNTMRQSIHKISNTTVMSPTDTWKLSDVNIKPQKGMQVAIGVYKNLFNKQIEASVEAYYKTMSDYLDYRNGAKLLMNKHLETDVLSTEGRAYGVELMLKKKTGKLNGWMSYTYAKTELRQKDKKILSPVNNRDWYPADFDKPHEFKFVGNYKFTHRFSFSLNCEYSTGRPVTLPVSKYEHSGGEFVYYSDRNQFRIPDYFRMDVALNIEPSHNLKLLSHSTINIGIYNVTGRKNAHSVYYVSEKGKLKGYRLAIFGAPIPYISYNIKF